jgi:hypothetical protein
MIIWAVDIALRLVARARGTQDKGLTRLYVYNNTHRRVLSFRLSWTRGEHIACYRLPFRFCLRSAPGAALRARAIDPSPPEANRTALRTLRTFPSSLPPSLPTSCLALFNELPRPFPNCFISAKFALFSASTDFSVGSNYTKHVKNADVVSVEHIPCASSRAASFRLQVCDRTCPCSLCSLVSSRACVLSPSSAQSV